MEAPETTFCLEKRVVTLSETPVAIGRSSARVPERTAKSSNLYLANSHISKEHARLHVQKNEVFVEDLNSSFGTVKNNELLVPFNRIPLKEGDELGFVLNRSLAHISSMRNKKGFLKTISLSSLLNPRVQVRFHVGKIDLGHQTIELTAFGHSCDSHLESAAIGARNEATPEEKSEYQQRPTNVSFQKLLNSESCQCTDVSDTNESLSFSGESGSPNSQLTGSLGGSECSVHSDELSDEESEIVVTLGHDQSDEPDLANLMDVVVGEASSAEKLMHESDAHFHSKEEEASENDSDGQSDCESEDESSDSDMSDISELIDESEEEPRDELDQELEEIRALIYSPLFPGQRGVIRQKQAWRESLRRESLKNSQSDNSQSDNSQRDNSKSDNSKSVSVSEEYSAPRARKRHHEELEFVDSAPPAKKKRSNAILWEVSKGAMYVTGALMAMVLYGGYLENSQS